MSHEQDNDPLRGGACTNLPPVAIDRYFFADFTEDRFAWDTAVVICGRCAVKAACLEQAITGPAPLLGVTAGQGPDKLQRLHTEYRRGTPVQELVDRVMERDSRRGTRRRYLHPKPVNPIKEAS